MAAPTDPSLDRLQEQLDEGWGAIDVKATQPMSGAEMLNAYDTSGDGVLDAQEMERVAADLAQQVEFNNQLVEQLRRLEESQLESQRQMQAKQRVLREALEACEAVRSKAASYRSKLQASNSATPNCRNTLTALR